jgi:hypothetical protein
MKDKVINTLFIILEFILGLAVGVLLCVGFDVDEKLFPQEEPVYEQFTAPLESSYVSFKGYTIPYTDTRHANSSPDYGAGMCLGSADTTDGTWGMFAAHNYGAFTPLLDVQVNDVITVCDDNGNLLAYKVTEVFDMDFNQDTILKDMWDRCNLGESGERIILRTCIDNGNARRVVIAWAQ